MDIIGSLDRTRTGSHEIESLVARLLSVRGQKSGSRGWSRTNTVTFNRGVDYCYPTRELKWSGISVPPRVFSWSQARRVHFLPHARNWRMAEGILPKPFLVLLVFKTRHRNAVL